MFRSARGSSLHPWAGVEERLVGAITGPLPANCVHFAQGLSEKACSGMTVCCVRGLD